MADDFFFSGLDSNSWFGRHFKPYLLFGYIGDRDKLTAYQTTKSLIRSIAEVIAPRISLASVLGKIAGVNLGLSKGESEVAKKIIDLINEAETKRQIDEFLKRAQARCLKEGHSFDSIGSYYNRRRAIMTADQNKMQNRLVVVEAQLINRGSISQYASNSAQQLAVSKEEWQLSDFPPHGLVEANTNFKGNLLRLKEDQGFSAAFAEYLPFSRHIGWYPYCKITGFYDTSTLATEVFPRMSICFVEYKRPKLYQEVGPDILKFLASEMSNPIYLRRPSERITAAYLLPIVTAGSSLKDYKVPDTSKPAVEKFVNSLEEVMPNILREWYQQALTRSMHSSRAGRRSSARDA